MMSDDSGVGAKLAGVIIPLLLTAAAAWCWITRSGWSPFFIGQYDPDPAVLVTGDLAIALGVICLGIAIAVHFICFPYRRQSLASVIHIGQALGLLLFVAGMGWMSWLAVVHFFR